MKKVKLTLPYGKQGQDMADHLEESDRASEALLNFSTQIEDAALCLTEVAAFLENDIDGDFKVTTNEKSIFIEFENDEEAFYISEEIDDCEVQEDGINVEALDELIEE